MAAGQPTKLTVEVKRIAEVCYKEGFTDAKFALIAGVTEQTVNNWKKKSPKFFASLSNWKAIADREVEIAFRDRCIGYSHPEDKIYCHVIDDMPVTTIVATTKHYPPDAGACLNWLKNRQPDKWRDKIEHELSGKVEIPGVALSLDKGD